MDNTFEPHGSVCNENRERPGAPGQAGCALPLTPVRSMISRRSRFLAGRT